MTFINSPGGVNARGTVSLLFEIDYNSPENQDVAIKNENSVLAIRNRADTAYRSIKFLGLEALGNAIFQDNVTIAGNLNVQGTRIENGLAKYTDKNIELAYNDTAPGTETNTSAEGGGISVLAGVDGDKTLSWSINGVTSGVPAWKSSENIQVATGKGYAIGDKFILSETELGDSIIYSSLTTLGIVTEGTWEASIIQPEFGGTGLSLPDLSGQAGKSVIVNPTGTGYELKIAAVGINNHVVIDPGESVPNNLAVNTSYIIRANDYNYFDPLLPLTAVIGEEIEVIVDTNSPIAIRCNPGQSIKINSIDGVATSNIYSEEGWGNGGNGNVVKLKCIDTNVFQVISIVGTWQKDATLGMKLAIGG